MRQTAVDYLIERFLSGDENIMQVMIKAKLMEKEQIEDAYDQMRCIGNYENGKQYYNETYAK